MNASRENTDTAKTDRNAYGYSYSWRFDHIKTEGYPGNHEFQSNCRSSSETELRFMGLCVFLL